MDYQSLTSLCTQVRGDILNMTHKAGSGHPGGSLSAVELLVGLYFSGEMAVDASNPDWEGRDRFILSKGHVAPVLYSVLARKGFFPVEELWTLRKLDSILQGHPHMGHTPGLDCSSGSLGQGLSIANGLALAFRMQGRANRVYCLLGDGELQEGQVWEAVMTAAQHKLDNLCAMVDYNRVQLDGTLAEIKVEAYRQAKACKGKPTVLMANTIKGKGVSFMENDCNWHGNAPNAEQLRQALSELGLEGEQ